MRELRDQLIYLEEDSVCRWNTLKHVAGDELDTGATGSLGDDVGEVHHAAFHLRERPGDGLRRRAVPAGDVDQRADPLEHLAMLPDQDVHREDTVRRHPVVDDRVERGVVVGHLPQAPAMGVLEDARARQLALEPVADPEEGGDEVRVEQHGHHVSLVPGADEEAGHRRERVDGRLGLVGGGCGIAGRQLLDGEDAGESEHAHEATQEWNLGRVERDPSDYLGQSGGAAVVVDGVGDAEVHGGLEGHGRDPGQRVGVELELCIEEASTVVIALSGRHVTASLSSFQFGI